MGVTDEPRISDLLLRSEAPAAFKLTPGQRLYYNYTLDDVSREAELANVARAPAQRDFRSLREKEQDWSRSE